MVAFLSDSLGEFWCEDSQHAEAIKLSGLANAWATLVVSAGHYIAMGHPLGVLMALSFITSLLSNLMSHTATAALMAPITMKICTAQSMNLA